MEDKMPLATIVVLSIFFVLTILCISALAYKYLGLQDFHVV